MNTEEIWLPVVGYEGYYEVSNLGRVRSLRKTLKNNIRNGYCQVGLFINGNRKIVYVHRLVAEVFIINPDNKPEVNHKDGIKTNNNVFNLEWATFKENNQHAFKTGLNKGTWTGKFGIENSSSKPVIQLDKVGNVLNKFGSMMEANRKTDIIYQNISKCCLGERKSAGGYIWKFDEETVT
jgi:hypothetical protein